MSYDILLPLVKRWVAGKTMDEAIKASKIANKNGLGVVLNYLGEEIKEEDEIKKTLIEYKILIKRIIDEKIDGSISIKPTQLGLSIDESTCHDYLGILIDYAKKKKIRVWLDMESSKYTEATIRLYFRFLEEYDDLGIAIQAYHRKSEEHVKKIIERNGMIRLVKGAYNEPASIVFKSKGEINKNFQKLMEYLFEKRARFCVATHDEKLIYKAVMLGLKSKHMPEFAFLRGIRKDLKKWLVSSKLRTIEYIPYGPRWKEYVYRRIRERKSNLLLVLTSLFSQ